MYHVEEEEEDRRRQKKKFYFVAFLRCDLGLNDTSYDRTIKVSEEGNRKLHPGNTLVQLFVLYKKYNLHRP